MAGRNFCTAWSRSGEIALLKSSSARCLSSGFDIFCKVCRVEGSTSMGRIFPCSTAVNSALAIADERAAAATSCRRVGRVQRSHESRASPRSEEHTSELQSLRHLVCRLLHEKKNE